MDGTNESSLVTVPSKQSHRSSSSIHSPSSPETHRESFPSIQAPLSSVPPFPPPPLSSLVFTPSVPLVHSNSYLSSLLARILQSNRQYSNQEIYRSRCQS